MFIQLDTTEATRCLDFIKLSELVNNKLSQHDRTKCNELVYLLT